MARDNEARAPRKYLARAVAAAAIAGFWLLSAVGSMIGTIGTTVGVTSLSAAVTAASSTPAEAF